MAALGLALLTGVPSAGYAQVISPDITISLAARKSTSLSLSLLSGSVQSITGIVDGTTNNFSSPVRLQTTWSVNPGLTGSVNLVAYFTDPTAAMSAGPSARIPSVRLEGRMVTGLPVAYTPFSGFAVGSVGTSGATLRLFSENVTGPNRNRTRTDELDLRLNLIGQPTLPAGTYTGTLYIRAVTL